MAKIELIDQSKNFISKLSRFQKMILGGALVVLSTVLILIIVLNSGKNVDMAVLYSQLSDSEASKIIQKLKEKNIKYDLRDGGSTIFIDKNQLYETRISMAGEGLPETGVLGYELFDKTNLGMSEFVQKINFRRALEGELARTIGSLDEVKKARVHIVVPEKALFEKDQKQPTASVTIHLKSGKSLSKVNISGIQNLVASSVEGLLPGSVNIIDQRGKIVSESPNDLRTTTGITAAQHEQQINVEQYVSNKVQTLLDGVLGAGNSEVRVNSELDFTQIEKTITDFDPDRQVVRSEQQISEKSQSTDSLSYPTVSQAKDQSNIISNYEVKKTVEKIVQEVGNIKRLSVAVLINGTNKIIDQPDGTKKLDYQPRTDEEMLKLTDIVKNAVGYNPSRNDQISVLSIPFENFQQEDEINKIKEVIWWQKPENIKLFLLLLAILITMFLMYRLLQSKPIRERFRIAFSLPEHVKFDEEDEPEEKEEDLLEEIELDEDSLMLLPAELPEQLLLEGEKFDDFGDNDDVLDKDLVQSRARAALDDGESVEMTEDKMMKIEIKGKVQEYVQEKTMDAIKLLRILISQDLDLKGFK